MSSLLCCLDSYWPVCGVGMAWAPLYSSRYHSHTFQTQLFYIIILYFYLNAWKAWEECSTSWIWAHSRIYCWADLCVGSLKCFLYSFWSFCLSFLLDQAIRCTADAHACIRLSWQLRSGATHVKFGVWTYPKGQVSVQVSCCSPSSEDTI